MTSIKSGTLVLVDFILSTFMYFLLWPLIWVDIYPLLNTSAPKTEEQHKRYARIYLEVSSTKREIKMWVTWLVEMAICFALYFYVNEYLAIYLAMASLSGLILGNCVKKLGDASL